LRLTTPSSREITCPMLNPAATGVAVIAKMAP
jgi:hypothetical protein